MKRLAALVLVLAGCQTTESPAGSSTGAKPSGGIQAEWIDKTVNPCDDFYQYACGSWLKNTPIPNDHAGWGSFDMLAEKNLQRLRETLEADAAGKGDAQDPYTQKLGDYYATCMDEAKIEAMADAQLAPS